MCLIFRLKRIICGKKNGYGGTKAFRERTRKIGKKKLEKAVGEKPDAFLYELAKQFGRTPQAAFLMLKKLKITRKKILRLL
jgi:hypothetical protein